MAADRKIRFLSRNDPATLARIRDQAARDYNIAINSARRALHNARTAEGWTSDDQPERWRDYARECLDRAHAMRDRYQDATARISLWRAVARRPGRATRKG